MSDDQQKSQQPGYVDTAKNYYNKQYENWMPWIEDNVLSYFGTNKTAYTTKGTVVLASQR